MQLLYLSALLILPSGCSTTGDPAAEPGDPKSVEVLESHAAALFRGDWKAAYAYLHPEPKAELSLKRFSNFHSNRRKADSSARSIVVTDCRRSGDDVIVSFDALFAPPGGGAPEPVPPRREVCLRRSGNTWALMTHDIFAVVSRPGF